MKLPPEVKEMFRQAGSKGGRIRMKKLSKRERRKFAMLGVQARRTKNGDK